MKFKELITLGLISLLGTSLYACNNDTNIESKLKNDKPIVRTINNQEYMFEGHKVTQLNSDDDTTARYGVISDIHGEITKLRLVSEKFANMDLDGIILPGDLSNNESLRYGIKDKNSNKQEILNVLTHVASTGLPIFVIPGNHETNDDYSSAMKLAQEKFSNIIDMTEYRVFDGDDVDFVSLPGYQTKTAAGRKFIPDTGFWADPNFIKKTGRYSEELDDSIILITHGAGYTNNDGKYGPATISNGKDVGDKTTTEMIKEHNINFVLSGHIHEAGGYASTHEGKSIKPGEWAEQFSVNFGSLQKWKNLNGQTYDGMAGIISIDKKESKYDMLILN